MIKVKKLKDFIDWTNGKKTLLGAIVHFCVIVLGVAQDTFNFHVIDASVLNQIDTFATGLIAVGLGHKLVKQI